MSVLENLPVEYRQSRPPTAVYPDRHQVAHYRDLEFPPTAAAWHRVFCINLEGGFFAPGAIQDMILPVAQSLRSGVYGPAVLIVITSDEATVEYLEALAERHELALFVLPPSTPLSQARPVGTLTKTDAQTLNLLVGHGGQVTSSQLAGLAGIELNAAHNRLRGLAHQGYVYRVERARREGDVFIDPRVAAEIKTTMAPAGIEPVPMTGSVELPAEVEAAVRALAEVEDTAPSELLAAAWREFVERHQEKLTQEFRKVADAIRDGKSDDLAAYLNRAARSRAEEAARQVQELDE